jgi:hypothetical protein
MKVGFREFGIAFALLVLCVVLLPRAHAQGAYRIAGKVVSSTTGTPLGRAKVTIADVQNRERTASVITGDDGLFAFANLPAGKYSLTAGRRGFVESSYMQHANYSTAIATGAEADSEHLVFRLTPQAVMTGRVVDEVGEPVRRARLTLYKQEQVTGIGQVRPVATARTDDRGTYEFAELAAGDYILSVSARPWYAVNPRSMRIGGGASSTRNSDGSFSTQTRESTVMTPEALPGYDVAYPATYYPDVTDSEDATPIPLLVLERLTVDMHLNPVPALRVMIRASNSPEHGFVMPQITRRSFDSSENLMTTFMDSRPQDDPEEFRQGLVNILGPGEVELVGIPPGKYMMRLPGTPGQAGAQSEVELTQDGQDVTPSASETAGDAKFAVRIAGETQVPQGLMLALRTPERRVVRAAPVDAQGKCDMRDVPPGKYDLLAATPKINYAVSAMAINGIESRGRVVEMAGGSSIDATLTLIAGQATVQGVAERDSKPIAGAMIVLVPKDPDGHLELFRRDQSDSDGTFSLRNVVPGEYTVLAIEDGWDLHWSEPGVIEHYVPKGQRVVVATSERGTVRLDEAVEVEAK